MKPILILTLFLFSFCFGQKEASNWYFGQNAGLKFMDDGSVVPLGDGQLNTSEGCSTISDVDGNLLFYTDGRTVWDRNHVIMPNGNYAAGTGLHGDSSSTASGIIVPKPGSPDIYYIFTVDEPHHKNAEVYPAAFTGNYGPLENVPDHDDGLNNGFNYSIVDLSVTGTNGSIGDVVSANNHLVTYNSVLEELKYKCSEKITAVKDLSSNSYWVITHFVNRFYAFKISAAGVDETPVVSIVAPVVPTEGYRRNAIGYLKSSPNGEKLATAHSQISIYPEDSYVGAYYVYDFNSSTGIVSNPINILSNVNAYGVEFSPDSKKLYAAYRNPANGVVFSADHVSQFNLESSDIAASRLVLSTGNYIESALQLAPNFKIYTTNSTANALSVINDPDILGVGCNLTLNSQPLAPGTARRLGLPPFITSFFDATFSVSNICLGSTSTFQISNSQNVTNVVWDFGDGNTGSGLNTSHTYTASGAYQVTMTATTPTETVVKSKEVTIFLVPIANPISDQTICDLQPYPYDLGQNDTQILGSQPSAEFEVLYFASAADALANVNQLPNLQTLPLGSTTFHARIQNRQSPSCYDITDFLVDFYLQPTANAAAPYVICEEAPYNQTEQFDLQTKVAEILGTQGSNPLISFHSTQSDADSNSSPLPLLYTNTQPSETIFVRVTNPDLLSCYVTTSFQISVVPSPRVVATAPFVKCDDNNDGQELFDLSTKLNEILDGQSPTVFQVKFYQSLADAQADANSLNALTITGVDLQEVFFAIANASNPDCRKTGSFVLYVSTKPVIGTVADYFSCDDASNDGIGIFDLGSKSEEILGSQSAADFTVTYHLTPQDALDNANPLPANYTNISNPQQIYVRVENNGNSQCFATAAFRIGLYKMPVALTPSNLFACDVQNDGSELFDLTPQNSFILGTQSAAEFDVTYHLSHPEAVAGTNALSASHTSLQPVLTIFARVSNTADSSCYDIVSFNLIQVREPEINLDDIYYICPGGVVQVSVPLEPNASYLWSTGETAASITISQSGSYSVDVTYDYGDITCQKSESFQVQPSGPATITDILVEDWTHNQNSITVIVQGDGVYEYSLDGLHYQDSNVFDNLAVGEYTVYVNDTRECGFVTGNALVLTYPRFFTPNGDGINDYWQVKFSHVEPNMELSVFDRYGKFVTNFKGSDPGWNGTLNGQLLPSTDYWFVIRRENGRLYKGHFSLKR